MIDLDNATITLSAALGLALVVERVIEFGKNVLDIMPTAPLGRRGALAQVGADQVADLTGRRVLDDKLAAIEAAPSEEEARSQARELVGLEQQRQWEESFTTATVLVEDASDPDEGDMLRVCMLQLAGLVTGIVAARLAGVQLFSALTGAQLIPWQDYLLTGLFIGGGSQPVHVLIRFIGERRVPPEVLEPQEPVAVGVVSPPVAGGAPAAPPPVADEWVEIAYDGGRDVDKLESIHRRPGEPNLIVYHHTAMPMESSFDEVVRVIHDRRSDGIPWVTGYHCVITADGGINPFCRWDRFGNHVAGFNLRSLGIAFNGNFETDPAVPYSNADGRYGPARPTEVQLDAGARIVALWTLLYDIPLEFGKTIVPHNQLNPGKACPGSRFPKDELASRVRRYVDLWQGSAAAKRRIEAFKFKPYLFVRPRS